MIRALSLTLFLLTWPLHAFTADLDRLQQLTGNGAVLLHSPAGEELISINPDRPLIPASLLKIPLADVALASLSADFRFETHFYSNASHDLLIRGLGDPFLVSEEIALIADSLAEGGLTTIRRLVMDDSAFEPNPDLPLQPGVRDPYGARNGALAVNFNTVNLAWAADGTLISAEPQTPLTPLARELSRGLVPGEAERINVGADPVMGLRQAQQLFLHFFARAGIEVQDPRFYHEALNEDWTLLTRYTSSRSLPEILAGLLRYSNNFIANQVFLTIGAREQGYPATAGKARRTLQTYLIDRYGPNHGDDPTVLLMREGSGLDRAQRSSAAAMMRILDAFEPHAELLPEINGVLRKSGTLSGVYNYAGYIRGAAGLHPFVILTNQAANRRDEILRLLQARVATPQ